MTPEFLLEAPVKQAAESTDEFLAEARLGGAAESRVELLREAPPEERPAVRLLREMPPEITVERLTAAPVERVAEPVERVAAPVEGIAAPVERVAEPVDGIAAFVESIPDLWDGQVPWETAAGGGRITREAPAPVERPFIAVVGLGHTGLPSALALRRAGVCVVGIDTSASRLEDIRRGRSTALGVRGEELREHLRDADFVLSGELELVRSAVCVLICVPAILDAERRPSLEALRRTCAAVVQHAHAGQTLVLASTGYVGCTRELLVEPLAERGLRAGEDVFVACSPERCEHEDVACSPERREHDDFACSPERREHDAASGARAHASRVLGAVSETCYAHASQVLRDICPSLYRVSSPEAAEMVRLYESTFRAVNTALAFEMADACRTAQLDIAEVTAAAASSEGFLAHHPSAGVGEHSVGVDPHHLLHPLRAKGRPALLAEEAMRTLAARPRRVAMRAHELLQHSGQRLRDMRVLVVGAAYKPGVSDYAGSPGVEIISWLAAEGVPVEYHDPLVPVLRIDDEDLHSIDPDPRRDASGFGPEDYDLVIVVTIQPGHDYGWLRRCPQVLDCTYSEPAGRRCLLP